MSSSAITLCSALVDNGHAELTECFLVGLKQIAVGRVALAALRVTSRVARHLVVKRFLQKVTDAVAAVWRLSHAFCSVRSLDLDDTLRAQLERLKHLGVSHGYLLVRGEVHDGRALLLGSDELLGVY